MGTDMRNWIQSFFHPCYPCDPWLNLFPARLGRRRPAGEFMKFAHVPISLAAAERLAGGATESVAGDGELAGRRGGRDNDPRCDRTKPSGGKRPMGAPDGPLPGPGEIPPSPRSAREMAQTPGTEGEKHLKVRGTFVSRAGPLFRDKRMDGYLRHLWEPR
jgi:hypothetical protein